MDRDYYQKYYTLERSNWWFKVRSRIIYTRLAEVIKPTSSFKILNIGAATGASSEMLSKFGSVFLRVWWSNLYVCKAESWAFLYDQASITNCHLKKKLWPGVCLRCRQSMSKMISNHEEMKRVCKKGGHIAVTVPAFMSLWRNTMSSIIITGGT